MTRFEVTACVLLHRSDRWLLSVRRDDVAYAPGRIGLIGGHVEIGLGPDILEQTARREVAEETGLELGHVTLHYLESIQYAGVDEQASVDVTFLAELPDGVEPRLTAPAELSAVGWWTTDEVAADPRSPDWLPALLARAAAELQP